MSPTVPHGAIPRQRSCRRVLLVERIPVLRRAYGRILATAGYDVDAATNGVEAFALAGAATPDVAVVEVGSSVPDGMALIERLQLRRLPVPVLAVAARDELEHLARRAGAGAFLTRPFGPHVLLPVVGVLLGATRPVLLHECGGASDPVPGATVYPFPNPR